MTVIFTLFALLLALLATLLLLSAGLFALSVVLSFSIAWYERIGSDPAVAGERRPRLAARLMLAEFCALLLTLLLRPFGWLPPRLPRGPTRRPPVILLHGLFQNRSCLLFLRWRLRRAGFDRIVSINTPSWCTLDELVDRLAVTVDAVRRAGGGKICLVGHSMGGILARCYLQQRGGASHVTHCVTIGSPHRGSKLAPFAVSRLGRDLLPGSELLTRLNAGPLPDGVRFTAVYSRHDNIIVPADSARLEGADNIELTEIGHAAMLFSPRLADEVVKALDETS